MENNSPGGLCSANATATSSVIEYKAEEEMRPLKWKDAVGPKRPPQVQSLCDPWQKHKLIPLVHRAAKAGGEGNHRVLTNAWKSLGGHHGTGTKPSLETVLNLGKL